MKHLCPKHVLIGLLVCTVVLSTRSALAQCPAGTVSNTAGNYTNGQAVCISTNFSGNISLHNGAIMYVVNGGTFTGDITATNGATIEVWAGGNFKPNNANNFAGNLIVKKNASATLGTGNISFSSGFSLLSQGNVIFAKAWTQNNTQSITNGSCGTMNFTQATTLQNNSSIVNNGTMIMGGLTTNSGTSINNRGTFIVTGSTTLSGYINNQWKMRFKGSGNTFNSGDSVINTYTMVFSNAMTGAPKMRNDGLLWFAGSVTFNGGGGINMKVSDAQLRIDGAVSNNTTITGAGASMYVNGAFGNNSVIKGASASQKIRLNKAPSNNAASNATIGSVTALDTASFIGGLGNPAVCTTLLPIEVTALKGTIKNEEVVLTWSTLTELNGKKFVVEYSTDGVAFTVAGEVAAKGNSNARVDYSYTFTRAAGATLYFRLRQVDMDGESEYSNIVTVKTGKTRAIAAGVYPNPFTEKLEVTLTTAQSIPVNITLFDMNGRIVKSRLYNGQSGANKFVLTGLSALKPGLYLVEVSAGEEKWIQKVIR